MPTVSINAPKTPVTQGSSGVAAATIPNICKMPGPPAPFVPTPLPNIGKSDSSPQGYSTTVKIEGNPVAIQGATFNSMGDVASQGTGGGLVSSNVEGPTSFAAPGSLDVKIEGKHVQLLGDQMLNNGGPSGSPPNSATMSGVLQGPRPDAGPPEQQKVVSVTWVPAEAFCGDLEVALGSTSGYSGGEPITVAITDQGGSPQQSVDVTVVGNAFLGFWWVADIVPPKPDHLPPDTKVDATACGVKSSPPLKVKFVTTLPKVEYAQQRTHFDLSMDDGAVTIHSELKYVPGWGGAVVNLDICVPPGTGGLLDGLLPWPGYRWMRTSGVTPQYWDGTTWKQIPAPYLLQDSNNFQVGFYAVYTPPLKDPSYVCQYGGSWPESFSDWSIADAPYQAKISAWKGNIESTWVGKFDLKREECQSKAKQCCRHVVKVAVEFTQLAAFVPGTLIIAAGNGRSNDSLFFLGEPRLAMAAHEFGHHIGNPDEYAGALVDASLNTDGAKNGIDENSLMGQKMTTVKARHFRTVCQVLSNSIKTTYGRTFAYKAVPP